MAQSPSTSRPPPPKVAPVEYKGVRYEEDMDSFRHGGDQPGGYLKATDIKTGERLWMLKVYTVEDQSAAGVGTMGIYFRTITQGPGPDQLEIENEGGARYVVDLVKRTSTEVSRPPARPKFTLPK